MHPFIPKSKNTRYFYFCMATNSIQSAYHLKDGENTMKTLALSAFLFYTVSLELSAAQVGFSFNTDGLPNDHASISIHPRETFTANIVGDFSDTSFTGGGLSITLRP
jgi:hypothetical protein